MDAAWWKHFEGQWVDTFRLNSLLGAGGFGGVFLADQIIEKTVIRKSVALKLILTSADQTERDLQELIAAATLRHAHIVECFHAGSATLERTKLLYLVMELAKTTLQSRLAGGVLPSAEAAELGEQMAFALAYLHERQRVHRDLKPGNVLRVGDAWKLSDFGLIRDGATDHTGRVTGTPRYMPPESFDGNVSTAWDVWSLGVLLLEVLTGQGPFPGKLKESTLMYAILRDQPSIPADLAKPFGSILHGCLTKDPKARWSAQDVLRAFQDHRKAKEADARGAGDGKARAATLPGHYYISYSTEDASDLVQNLTLQLSGGVPAVKTWVAAHDLQAGRSSDDQIEQAIESCESFLFVMSRGSVSSTSKCRSELNFAAQCEKPIIPLLAEPGVRVPLTLANVRCIDFTGDFGAALAQLRKQITASPGSNSNDELAKLEKELAEAELAIGRAWRPGMRAELGREIQQLKTEIAFEKIVLRDPVGQSIAAARKELNDLFAVIESIGNLGEAIYALITKAIHHGAPIYNLGSHIGCAAIYDYTAKLIFRLLERPEGSEKPYQSAAAKLRQVSFDALNPGIANQRAWQLRHAFDSILEELIPQIFGHKH